MRQRPSEDDIRTTYRTVDQPFDFVIRRCRGDQELAEDITQETWLRAVDDWERREVHARQSVLAEQMKLRNEFLERGTPSGQLVQRLESARPRGDASYIQAELDAARARLAIVQKKHALGVASDVESLRAELAVKELEIQLQQLAARLRTAP